MPRVVVLGCGTGVGKTRVSVALLNALSHAGVDCTGLKPVESGIAARSRVPRLGSDADALARAGSLRAPLEHPLYPLKEPVSPHLAARLEGIEISSQKIQEWVTAIEHEVTPHVLSHSAWMVIETAGGVFSPLAPGLTNFDLALALEPAIWVLVAADALGVLHEISASLRAMRASNREPDYVVLSAAREPDASTGRNAQELSALGIVTPTALLERDDDRGIQPLLARLLAAESGDG